MSTEPLSKSRESQLNRLIEAMSPPLSAALDTVLEERRQKLLAEATVQLRKALLDQEAELRAVSEADQKRVRGETAAEIRREVTRELESRFGEKLSSELHALKDRLDDLSRKRELEWDLERAGLRGEAERWRILAEFHRRTGTVTSQTEILKRFLRSAGHFAGGVVLYLNKPEGLARWETEGDTAAFPQIVSEDTKDPEWYWMPLTVRSRMVVAIGATGVLDREALDALVGALRRAIETLGLRLGSGVHPDGAGGNGETGVPAAGLPLGS